MSECPETGYGPCEIMSELDRTKTALKDLRIVAEGLAEALNATGLGRHHRRKPDWMDEAIDAYDAWKKKNP